ncbi:MAG: hypothetical protein ACREDP_12745 [Bradyrhizobium sp.]
MGDSRRTGERLVFSFDHAGNTDYVISYSRRVSHRFSARGPVDETVVKQEIERTYDVDVREMSWVGHRGDERQVVLVELGDAPKGIESSR